MEKITTTSRIHPLMAAAALSVITISVAGTAAITGMLPSSKADTAAAAPVAAVQPAPTAQQLADAQMLVAKYSPPAEQVQAAPLAQREAPVIKRAAARPAPRTTHVVHHYAPAQRVQPVQQASTPNYVGIGAGAVIGGLLGHQIGGGNGKKLATVAGVIGGGMLGNEIANRNK